MSAPNCAYTERKGPAHCVKHWQCPEIVAALSLWMAYVKVALDNIADGRKVKGPVRILHALWPCRGSRGVRQSDQVVLVLDLSLKSFPPTASHSLVVVDAFLDRKIELSIFSIGVSVDEKGYVRMTVVETVQ